MSANSKARLESLADLRRAYDSVA